MKTQPRLQQFLEWDNRQIPYDIHLSFRRSVRIIISNDGRIDVHVPRYYDDNEIANAVRKKASWIAKTLHKISSYQILSAPKQYISGEKVAYLGNHYRLHIEKGLKREVVIAGNSLRVVTDCKPSPMVIKSQVDFWYRQRARETFEHYLEISYAATFKHLVAKPILTIRKMRSRWGSCSVTGRVNLNLDLVFTPPECIEYVIIHELCHLIHHNHSPDYYVLLTQCLPDWRVRKQKLDRFKIE